MHRVTNKLGDNKASLLTRRGDFGAKDMMGHIYSDKNSNKSNQTLKTVLKVGDYSDLDKPSRIRIR
jgi:hypothetical protein